METKEVFDELEKEAIKQTGGIPEHVKTNLDGSIKFINLFSEMVELFIPKFINTASQLFDGSETAEITVEDDDKIINE